MIDPVKILQRAWYIVWNYRALWVFGLILALAAGGSLNGNGNNGMNFRDDGQSGQGPSFENAQEAMEYFRLELNRLFTEGIPEANITGEALTAFLWTVGVFVVFMLLISVAVTIAYYVSASAVIRMVDEYENTGTKMTVREGFRIGWSRAAWRLFLINLIVNLPAILFFVAVLVAAASFFLSFLNGNANLTPPSLVGIFGLILLGGFIVLIWSTLFGLLRPFFWRVAVLENAGVRESLQRGFALVRENWKSAGLMWLVMIGLGIAWIAVSIIAFIITIPIVIVTAILAILISAIPALVLFGIFSLFLTGHLPWIAAGLFVLPLFFTIAFSPWLLVGSWKEVYASTVWTLTYRELKALPAVAPQAEVVPVGD
jgi:hypothetical protein